MCVLVFQCNKKSCMHSCGPWMVSVPNSDIGGCFSRLDRVDRVHKSDQKQAYFSI